MATCGGCNLQGDVKTKGGRGVVFCFLDNEWHPGDHSCERWVQYSSNIGISERRAIAEYIHVAAKRIEKSNRGYVKTAWSGGTPEPSGAHIIWTKK